ncbi:putative bifunctional diguanylate cyclase/phosphodiesterase [Pseudoduganella rivuli]|nr:EAL domain-containing protein [Pseudoduganella rivuli]
MAASMTPPAEEIAERLAYLDIQPSDLSALRELRPLIKPHLDAVIEAFYSHLYQFPQLRAMLADAHVAQRLHLAHVTYFDRLTEGEIGADYVQNRLRIGLVHHHCGLEPIWYIGAYRKYLTELAPLIRRLLSDTPERIPPALHALGKVATFDVALALDTYIECGRRQILELKDYSEQIISSLPCGVIVADSDGRVRTVNQAMLDISGFSEQELLQRRRDDLIPPPGRELTEGYPQPHEFLLRRREGDPVWVKATFAPMHAANSGTVTVVEDISQRKRYEEDLVRLANYDALTGLANRTLLLIRLEHAIAAARRQQRAAAILFLDLDRFKTINDSLGHDAGDRVLIEVGRRIQRVVRETDTVARLGGDEFVVFLSDLYDEAPAAILSHAILDVLSRPMLILGHEISLSCSIGISVYPQDGADAKQLLKNADAAMYQAKALGRCNYQYYSPEMNARTLDRLTLENGLRHAIERHELVVLYQPQYSLATGAMTGVEALLRWLPPGRDVITPDVFIPIAEDSGLIVPIGEWVLRTACAQQVAWKQAGLGSLRIAVNLSARQFRQAGMEVMVAQALEDSGCDAGCLELEITESVLMDRPDSAAETLQRLSRMGVRLAIDDFGTGYSSLAYLKRFPIDVLKIDRSFVRDIPGDSDDAAIATAVTALAHSMHMSVVAEGVETEAQRDFLRSLQCDYVQGYLYSKPIAADAVATLLKLAL